MKENLYNGLKPIAESKMSPESLQSFRNPASALRFKFLSLVTAVRPRGGTFTRSLVTSSTIMRGPHFYSMNTRLSGSVRIDSTDLLPSGEFRGQAKLIKSTEDVRKFAAEQRIGEESALDVGLKEKAKEFVEKGAEVYAPS
jgi:hypothetical protein